LLSGSPRYAAALNTGSNVQAFGSGLQRGGYATDPDYVNKLVATVATLRQMRAAALES
jgi:flagellar protein FlgJ